MLSTMSGDLLNVVVGGSSSLGRYYLKHLPWESEGTLATFYQHRDEQSLILDWQQCDVSVVEDLDRLVDNVLSRNLPVRLVWFPGVLTMNPRSSTDWNELVHLFKVNAIATTYVVSKLVHELQYGSRICLCSSVSALQGSFDIAYASSKSALSGLVFSSARLCRDGLSVFGIAPNSIEDTAMFRSFSPETKLIHRARAPKGILTRKDVSEEIYRLMQEQASKTNGKIFPIGVGP